MYKVFKINLPGYFRPLGFQRDDGKLVFYSKQSFCIYDYDGFLIHHVLFPSSVSSAVFSKGGKEGYIIAAEDPTHLHRIDIRGIVTATYTLPSDSCSLNCDPFGHLFITTKGMCYRLLTSEGALHCLPTNPISFPVPGEKFCCMTSENGYLYLYMMSLDESNAIITKSVIYFLPKRL